MLIFYNQPRGSGKTAKIIKMLENDERLIVLVPSGLIKDRVYPKNYHKRVFTINDFENFMQNIYTHRSKEVLVDELLLSNFKIAKIFYELGRIGIDVSVMGTEHHGYWYKRIN